MVSIIIPTYNRASQLSEAIQSVLAQTYSDFNLIVVDDGSIDDTEKIIAEIRDDRISYHRLNKNLGAAGARNEGARLAEGEWIAFNDSDDLWLPDKLEKQFAYMEENPDAGMVYGKVRVHSPGGIYEFPNYAITGDLEGELYTWLLRRNTIDTPTMFIRKRCFEEVGGFDSSLRCLEDWEFAIRFSQRFKIGYIDKVLLDSFVSEGGVSRNIGAYYESRCRMIAQHKENIIKLGLFDDIVIDVFSRAEKSGVLTQVQKMLITLLA